MERWYDIEGYEDYKISNLGNIKRRNAMYISRNDGKLSKDILHNKDTLINGNGLINLARYNYSQEQLNRIKAAKLIN